MQGKVNLKVDWCSYEAAKYACLHWHYSKCTPQSKQVWIGVWEDDIFIGVVSFGRSSTPYLGTAFNLETTECVELTRIALNKHKTQVSKIVSISFKLLKKQSPGIKLIVSFADPLQGNWIYIGTSSSNIQYFFRSKWRNDSPLMRHLQKNPLQKDILEKRKVPGKHKYLMPLNKEMRKQILLLSKPYPKAIKCPTSIDSDATSDQPGEGGVSPTVGLHIKTGQEKIDE